MFIIIFINIKKLKWGDFIPLKGVRWGVAYQTSLLWTFFIAFIQIYTLEPYFIISI